VAGPGLGGGGGEYVPGVTVVSVATLCAAFEKCAPGDPSELIVPSDSRFQNGLTGLQY
jgi:hypothetical protein